MNKVKCYNCGNKAKHKCPNCRRNICGRCRSRLKKDTMGQILRPKGYCKECVEIVALKIGVNLATSAYEVFKSVKEKFEK